jgi:hypothetical protein
MVWEVVNRLVAVRHCCHRPDGESRYMPDDRMLWNWTALKRFANFPTINSFLSNAAEIRRLSRHVVGFPMEIRPSMTRREVVSELPHRTNGAIRLRVVRL